MCIELFGDIATPYVMLFYLVSSCFTQLIGIPLVRWSGEAGGFSMQMIWKFLRAPTVVSVFLSLLLVGLDIHLPSLVMSYAKYINNTVTPLALLLTGCIIHEIGLRSLRLTPTLGVMMVFRFVISPALGAALCALLGIGGLVRSVYVVELAMPVVTQTVVAAAEYGAAPFALIMPFANLFWTLVCTFLSGLIIASAFSSIVVYATDLMPDKVGLIAGIFFGLMFGLGGLGSAFFGWLADKTSIEFIFQVSAFLPLLGIIAGFLPNTQKKRS